MAKRFSRRSDIKVDRLKNWGGGEVTKREKELLRLQLQKEKSLIKDLKKAYSQARTDIQLRIKELMAQEQTQSKIYQLNYQKALEAQINGILDVLNGNNTQTIIDYLIKTYEDGYIGTMYILNGYNIPLIFPIDQRQMFNIINKKIEDMTFAQRLNTNMKEFKKTIKAEISRGIANNSSYGEIAKQIQLRINENFNRSYRIANTEMGRVSSESKYKAACIAKENGADLVKQWNSTLDMRTRPDHAALDNQIKEIDEPFEINGHKAQHPHGFEVASLDINCRCVSNIRPRWDKGDTGTFSKMVHNKLKDRAELMEFTPKSYKEFKKEYWNKYNLG